MATKNIATRRTFLKQGALLAGPIAAVAVPTAAAAMADDGQVSRLQHLEDEAAIAKLHREWLRLINVGSHQQAAQLFADPKRAAIDASIRGVAEDHAGSGHVVAINGAHATGRCHCAATIQTELAQDCTLAQMAHAQGEGLVRHTEQRVLAADYVKQDGVWKIARIDLIRA